MSKEDDAKQAAVEQMMRDQITGWTDILNIALGKDPTPEKREIMIQSMLTVAVAAKANLHGLAAVARDLDIMAAMYRDGEFARRHPTPPAGKAH